MYLKISENQNKIIKMGWANRDFLYSTAL